MTPPEIRQELRVTRARDASRGPPISMFSGVLGSLSVEDTCRQGMQATLQATCPPWAALDCPSLSQTALQVLIRVLLAQCHLASLRDKTHRSNPMSSRSADPLPQARGGPMLARGPSALLGNTNTLKLSR